MKSSEYLTETPRVLKSLMKSNIDTCVQVHLFWEMIVNKSLNSFSPANYKKRSQLHMKQQFMEQGIKWMGLIRL